MDRIKYRRMLPVYLSDMEALEERDPNIWQFFFIDGNFSVQINHIPGTAKRCGPCRCAGKQKTEDTRWFNRYHKTRKQQE